MLTGDLAVSHPLDPIDHGHRIVNSNRQYYRTPLWPLQYVSQMIEGDINPYQVLQKLKEDIDIK